MIHFYPKYFPKNPDVIRCNDLAAQSWTRLRWKDVPILDADLPRMFREDGKPMPYMKDVFDLGSWQANIGEICVYSNTDIQVRSDADFIIANHLQDTDAAYCFRRDFPKPIAGVIPDHLYASGHDYAGSDLYAFRASWWRQHRDKMPDLILGYESWDAILRCIIEMTNPGKPVRLYDLIAHEKDGRSWWETPQNRYTLKGQKHCLTLSYRWLLQNGYNPSKFGIMVPRQ